MTKVERICFAPKKQTVDFGGVSIFWGPVFAHPPPVEIAVLNWEGPTALVRRLSCQAFLWDQLSCCMDGLLCHCSLQWQWSLANFSFTWFFIWLIVQFGFLGIHSYWPPVKLQLFCKQFNRKSSDHGVSNCDKKSFLVEIHFWKNTCKIFYSWQTIFARPSPDPLVDFGCMQKLYKRAAVNQILHNILRYLTIFDNIWQCLPQYLPKYLWPHHTHLQTAGACRN